MRELDEIVETEDSGAAFDRMNGTKYRVDGVVRGCSLAQSERPNSICCSASLHSSKNVPLS
jgi:hypothetical protein